MAENKKAVCGGFLVGDGLEMDGKVLKATGEGSTVVVHILTEDYDYTTQTYNCTADMEFSEILALLKSGTPVVLANRLNFIYNLCLMNNANIVFRNMDTQSFETSDRTSELYGKMPNLLTWSWYWFTSDKITKQPVMESCCIAQEIQIRSNGTTTARFTGDDMFIVRSVYCGTLECYIKRGKAPNGISKASIFLNQDHSAYVLETLYTDTGLVVNRYDIPKDSTQVTTTTKTINFDA